MNLQLILIWDDRDDEIQIAVAGDMSYEQAEAKAVDYARNRLNVNVEGSGGGDPIETVAPGMYAI